MPAVSRFEYLSVLVSIVIALGIGETMISWGRLLQLRERVSFSWLHGFWSLFTLFLLVQFWWGFWNFRVVEVWSLGSLVGVLAEAVTLVLCGLVLTPRISSSELLDLRELFFANSRPFFLLGALLITQLAVVDTVVAGMPSLQTENAFRAGGIGVALFGAATHSQRTHAWIACAAATLLAGFLASSLML